MGHQRTHAKEAMLYAEPSQVPVVLGSQRALMHETLRNAYAASACRLDESSRGRRHSLPPRGTKLPVPMPMSTTTTNRAAIEESPQGIQIAKTTASEKTFIKIVALRGPRTRSESQRGRVRPSTAPLWMFSRQGREAWSGMGETHMLYDIIK